MVTTQDYVYRVTEVTRVVDGDTYWLRLDVGFRQEQLTEIRLYGVDCPERHRGSVFEKAEAKRATQEAEEWLAGAHARGVLWVRTHKDPDDFGRWLGEVWADNDTVPEGREMLGDYLKDIGLATTWPTRWHDVYDKGA